MEKIKVSFDGTSHISDVHHIGMSYNGNYYSVIFGKYINGGFCCIPNWETGCELAHFKDVFWNTESIGKALNDPEAGRVIAEMIATLDL